MHKHINNRYILVKTQVSEYKSVQVLANLFCKNYSNVILQIIGQNHLEAGTLIYVLYLHPNGTILIYTMLLLFIELIKHVRYTDVKSMQHLRWSSLRLIPGHLTPVTKSSILDIAKVLDQLLHESYRHLFCISKMA